MSASQCVGSCFPRRTAFRVTVVFCLLTFGSGLSSYALDKLEHQVTFSSPSGFLAKIDPKWVKIVGATGTTGEAWRADILLTDAPLDHALARMGGLGGTPISVVYKTHKEGTATASVIAKDNSVRLPGGVLFGVYDLARLKGDDKTARKAEALIKALSGEKQVEYSWGAGFVGVAGGRIEAKHEPVPKGMGIAFDDPQGELKSSLDAYISGYLLMNFAKYSKNKQDVELFRNLSERLLTKDLVARWFDITTP